MAGAAVGEAADGTVEDAGVDGMGVAVAGVVAPGEESGGTEAAACGGVSASSARTASIIGSAAVPNGKRARSMPCASTRKMSAVCAIA